MEHGMTLRAFIAQQLAAMEASIRAAGDEQSDDEEPSVPGYL
jgi:hypothetical protein